MDPFTLAFLILSTVAGAVGAASTVASGKQQASAALTSAAISKHNVALQEYNAKVAQQKMENEQRDSRRKFAALMGNTQAQSGAMGVGISGSISDILDDQLMEGFVEAQRITTAGKQEVYAYKSSAYENQMQSKAFTAQAKGIRSTSFLTATGQLLGGAAQGISGVIK